MLPYRKWNVIDLLGLHPSALSGVLLGSPLILSFFSGGTVRDLAFLLHGDILKWSEYQHKWRDSGYGLDYASVLGLRCAFGRWRGMGGLPCPPGQRPPTTRQTKPCMKMEGWAPCTTSPGSSSTCVYQTSKMFWKVKMLLISQISQKICLRL